MLSQPFSPNLYGNCHEGDRSFLSSSKFGQLEVKTGTTLVACTYNGGVIIGADSRTSMGSYVAHRTTDKLTPLTSKIYCCRSGSSADTQAVADVVKYQLDFHRIEMDREPTVLEAATVFRHLCYDNRDQLSAGIIVAGWDEVRGGQGGMLIQQPAATGGSGSTYIYGFLDSNYKPGMDKQTCVDFVKRCVSLAIHRDGSSGGCIRVACISKDGVENTLIKGDAIPEVVHI